MPTVEEMIMELLDSGELTVWEYDFIDNLADKEEDYVFSESQEAKVEEIYKSVIL